MRALYHVLAKCIINAGYSAANELTADTCCVLMQDCREDADIPAHQNRRLSRLRAPIIPFRGLLSRPAQMQWISVTLDRLWRTDGEEHSDSTHPNVCTSRPNRRA